MKCIMCLSSLSLYSLPNDKDLEKIFGVFNANLWYLMMFDDMTSYERIKVRPEISYNRSISIGRKKKFRELMVAEPIYQVWCPN